MNDFPMDITHETPNPSPTITVDQMNGLLTSLAQVIHQQTSAVVQATPAATARSAAPPRYTGNERELPLDTWLYRAHQYVSSVQDPLQRINVAATYLDGNAAIWWQGHVVRDGDNYVHPYQTWSEFADALRRHLCPGITIVDDAIIRLKTITQGTKSISDYILEFNNTRTRAEVPDTEYCGHMMYLFFISGLNPDIRFEIQKAQPKDLQQAIQVATQLEGLRRQLNKATNSRPQPVRQQYAPAAKSPAPPPPPSRPQVTPMDVDAIGRLSEQERDELRRNGGCFRCRQYGHVQRNCPLRSGNDLSQ